MRRRGQRQSSGDKGCRRLVKQPAPQREMEQRIVIWLGSMIALATGVLNRRRLFRLRWQ
jgi:hypothetical protein